MLPPKHILYKKHLNVEIADTPYKQHRGLMFRNKIDHDAGMLFKFNKPRKLSFWGHNTFIPLDIAFISPDKKITKIDHISPLSSSVVSSEENCDMAIEANYNFFADNKVRIGNNINIYSDGISNYITFEENKNESKTDRN